jgi:hypothetical protein
MRAGAVDLYLGVPEHTLLLYGLVALGWVAGRRLAVAGNPHAAF